MEIPVSRKSFKRDETSQSWDAAAACLASMHLQVSRIRQSAPPGGIIYVLENDAGIAACVTKAAITTCLCPLGPPAHA